MPLERLLVTDCMTAPVVTISAAASVTEADALLRMHGISALLVLGRSGQAAGVISRRDLLRVGRILAHVEDGGRRAVLQLPQLACGDLMTHPVLSVAPTALVEDACRLLLERRVHRVFVLSGGQPVGVFSTKEAMRAVKAARLATPLGDIMTRELVTVDAQQPWSEAARLLDRAGVGGVVVTEQSTPIGLFGETEALAARACPPTQPTEEVMTQAMLCLPMKTPLFRAAGFAIATTARRILVTKDHHAKGVVSGFDFVRAFLEAQPSPIEGVKAG